ncbi:MULTISPECIES: hypothetical protein [Empedobacter]|uniref:Uncharacterized protein n=1 Tax=Empedobacter falsenii TaxID=343874 RepID=A0AAW7DI82_9FLAO|nr:MULTISPECIES: hypothetical protein [Empedobacter]MDM1138875.1 hypothetical protein [Empedobacter sp. R132-2]MDM1551530.1 hypothetical protein [Empedobacter falsenii]
MTEIKFTIEQLLLTLNYDTNKNKVFTLTERCEIHQVINGRKTLSKELQRTIKDLLLKLRINNYKRIFTYYQENKITTEKELIISK